MVIRCLQPYANTDTSPTFPTTAGAHRPAAGSPGAAVITPSLSIDNHQKLLRHFHLSDFLESHFNLSRTRRRLAPILTDRGSHYLDGEGQIAALIE